MTRSDYQLILRLFQEIATIYDKKFQIPIMKFVDYNGRFDAENYWIECLKFKETKYEKLGRFFMSL